MTATEMTTENLTGFDAELRALAERLMPPDAGNPFPGRAWLQDSLFEAMRTYAEIHSDRPKADILTGCESIGRIKAEGYAGRWPAKGHTARHTPSTMETAHG